MAMIDGRRPKIEFLDENDDGDLDSGRVRWLDGLEMLLGKFAAAVYMVRSAVRNNETGRLLGLLELLGLVDH